MIAKAPRAPADQAGALMWITARPDIVFASGQGSWLTDQTGKRHLDFVQGWAVNCLGHCHPAVTRALTDQASTLVNPSPAFYNPPAMELAQRLVGCSVFDRVFFANSGAEANEGAIKLARKWGRKHRQGAFEIITFENAFHGRTLAAMSASGKPGWDTLYAPQVPGFPKARLNDIDSVRALVGPQTVAVMLEPIQGEAGVIPAADAFLQELRALTEQHGILLMVDEVQTGMGRAGTLFAYEQAGIVPDVMTLGKGIGGGVPLSALLAREAVRQLRAWLADGRFEFALPLAPAGTPFQRRVWAGIAAIPAGQTRSYGELAATLGSGPRAVGNACGANPYPLVVPCHRVVAAGGGLGGFARQRGGFLLQVKSWLLQHERG